MISNFLVKLFIFMKVYGLILKTNGDSVEIVIDGITYNSNRDRLDASQSPVPGWYIYAYQALISPNNKFALAVHPSGNIILYLIEANHWAYGMILWQSNTVQQDLYATTPNNYMLRLQMPGSFIALWKSYDSRNYDSLIWQSNGIECYRDCNYPYAVMQNDGNFVLYDKNGNSVWGTMNNYPPGYLIPVDSYTSLSSDGAYRYLVAYIPTPGQSYEDAKANNQEWCLSAGMLYHPDENDPNNGAQHDLHNDDQNLYWCDNHPAANQNCKCLGIHDHEDSWVWNYYVNGKKYWLAFYEDGDGDGNQIQDDEFNLKGITTGFLDNEYIFKWINNQLVCLQSPLGDWSHWPYEYQYWCLEWDADVQIYRDTIDGTLKEGREAKLEEADYNPDGDRIEWSDATLNPTKSPTNNPTIFTNNPTRSPTNNPTTKPPTNVPTKRPTLWILPPDERNTPPGPKNPENPAPEIPGFP